MSSTITRDESHGPVGGPLTASLGATALIGRARFRCLRRFKLGEKPADLSRRVTRPKTAVEYSAETKAYRTTEVRGALRRIRLQRCNE